MNMNYVCKYVCMLYRLPTVSDHFERKWDQYNQLLPAFPVI